MSKAVFSAVLALLFCTGMHTSKADEVYKTAVLICDTAQHKAIVRFGYRDDPLPYQLADAPSEASIKLPDPVPYESNQSCTLEKVGKIELLYGEDAQQSYGQGGGNPYAHFTLKINDKIIYYKKDWYEGRSIDHEVINALIIQPGKLQECDGIYASNDGMEINPKPTERKCIETSARLTSLSLTGKEQRLLDSDNKKRGYIEINNAPDICSYFSPATETQRRVDAQKAVREKADLKREAVKQKTKAQIEREAVEYFMNPLLADESDGVSSDNIFSKSCAAVADIDNDSRGDFLYYFSNNYHDIDHSYIVKAANQKQISIADCEGFGFGPPVSPEDFFALEESVEKSYPGAKLYAGDTILKSSNIFKGIDHSTVNVRRYKNQTYLIIAPTAPSYDDKPSYLVVQAIGNKFETLCTYKPLVKD